MLLMMMMDDVDDDDDDVVVVVFVAVWRIEPNKTFNGERRTYTGIWLFDWLHGQVSTKEVPILLCACPAIFLTVLR